jgi:hypothetical protein
MTRWVWRCLFVGALLVAGVGIPEAATQDNVTYVCVHRVTGHVRVVSGPEESHPSETVSSLQGGLPYAVVDATGQKVGETIRLDAATATVVVTLQDMKFPLEVTTQGFTVMNPLLFSTSNCSGLPYVYPSLNPWFPPLMRPVMGPLKVTLYIPDPTRNPLPTNVPGSVLNIGIYPTQHVCPLQCYMAGLLSRSHLWSI